MTGGQQHDGFIKPGGEIRGLCGSPHIVTGAFQVSGPDSPVLTIAAGAAVRVAAKGAIVVGYHGPGGLQVNGAPWTSPWCSAPTPRTPRPGSGPASPVPHCRQMARSSDRKARH